MGFDNGGFEEMLRALARELSDSVERTVGELDIDELAGRFGVDADRAREFVRGAGEWLREQSAGMGEHPASRGADPRAHERPPAPERPDPRERPEPHLRSVPPHERRGHADRGFAGMGPHPLDLPTEEQGTALAALDSGRWSIEPGSGVLTVTGQGPGPNDALGLVRELRVRDWISAEGALTLAGRRALARWLEHAG